MLPARVCCEPLKSHTAPLRGWLGGSGSRGGGVPNDCADMSLADSVTVTLTYVTCLCITIIEYESEMV